MEALIVFDWGTFYHGGGGGFGGWDQGVEPAEFHRFIVRQLRRGVARLELTVTAIIDDPREYTQPQLF